MKNDRSLSRRERQIMDIVYEMKEATAQQIMERLPSPPSYSAVRALVRVLEQKGHLVHRQDGPRYIYVPRLAKDKASRSALAHLKQTFFDGSTTDVVAALLDHLGRGPLGGRLSQAHGAHRQSPQGRTLR